MTKMATVVLAVLLILVATPSWGQIPAPKNFRPLQVTDSSIKVAWTAVEGVSGYELYLWTLFYFSQDTVGFFSGLEPETDYGLAVRGWVLGAPTELAVLLVRTLPAPSTSVDDTEGVIPITYGLEQNYPNPFNPETTIRYQLAGRSEVSLKVYNLLGQEVRRLVDRSQAAGYHVMAWDGRDNAGNTLPSGVYFYRLESGGFTAMKKMILMK